MKETVLISIVGISSISSDICDDLVEILSYVPLVDDIVESAADADISLVVFPGRNVNGHIWEGRSMGSGSSRMPGLPHMLNPLIPEYATSEDLGICDDILFFFPEELQNLKEIVSTDRAFGYASGELSQLLVQYLYSDTVARDIYDETMNLFEQLKATILE